MFCLFQSHQRVGGLSRLSNGDDERVGVNVSWFIFARNEDITSHIGDRLDPILCNKPCVITCAACQDDDITYLFKNDVGIFAEYVGSSRNVVNRSFDTRGLLVNFLEHMMFKLTEGRASF